MGSRFGLIGLQGLGSGVLSSWSLSRRCSGPDSLLTSWRMICSRVSEPVSEYWDSVSGSESESEAGKSLHSRSVGSRVSWGKWNCWVVLVQLEQCPLVLLGDDVRDSLGVLGSVDGKGLSLLTVVEILHGSRMSWFLVNLPPLPV